MPTSSTIAAICSALAGIASATAAWSAYRLNARSYDEANQPRVMPTKWKVREKTHRKSSAHAEEVVHEVEIEEVKNVGRGPAVNISLEVKGLGPTFERNEGYAQLGHSIHFLPEKESVASKFVVPLDFVRGSKIEVGPTERPMYIVWLKMRYEDTRQTLYSLEMYVNVHLGSMAIGGAVQPVHQDVAVEFRPVVQVGSKSRWRERWGPIWQRIRESWEETDPRRLDDPR